MQAPTSPLPEYETPPVMEVVFGIQFKELQELKTPHVGTFWEKIGRTKFPECQEMPPLPHVTETYDRATHEPPKPKVVPLDRPSLLRVFFIARKKDELIQLQRDRFLRNWKKLDEGAEYPRYKELFPRFVESWQVFSEVVRDLNVGPLEVDQYELTYLNHIPKGDVWAKPKDIEKVFPDIRCKADGRFLPEQEEMAWHRVYRFPEQVGRLHVSMRQAMSGETKKPILVLNLTARGFKDDLTSWFDMAHEWIVRGFADLTGPDIQKSVWKRKNV